MSIHAQPVTEQGNLLAEAARGVGVQQCQKALARMGALTLQGAQSHDVLIDWDRAEPDKGPVFSLLGMKFGQGGAFASITAIPKSNGECVVTAERVTSAPFTCHSIAQVELQDYRQTALMPGFVVYTSPSDANSTVALIDAVPNCLVMRRYVHFAWKDESRAKP